MTPNDLLDLARDQFWLWWPAACVLVALAAVAWMLCEVILPDAPAKSRAYRHNGRAAPPS